MDCSGELARLMAATASGLMAGTLLLPAIFADGFRLGVSLLGMAYAVSHLFPSFAPVRLPKEGLAGVNRLNKLIDQELFRRLVPGII
jgi:hypothetical protein